MAAGDKISNCKSYSGIRGGFLYPDALVQNPHFRREMHFRYAAHSQSFEPDNTLRDR